MFLRLPCSCSCGFGYLGSGAEAWSLEPIPSVPFCLSISRVRCFSLDSSWAVTKTIPKHCGSKTKPGSPVMKSRNSDRIFPYVYGVRCILSSSISKSVILINFFLKRFQETAYLNRPLQSSGQTVKLFFLTLDSFQWAGRSIQISKNTLQHYSRVKMSGTRTCYIKMFCIRRGFISSTPLPCYTLHMHGKTSLQDSLL